MNVPFSFSFSFQLDVWVKLPPHSRLCEWRCGTTRAETVPDDPSRTPSRTHKSSKSRWDRRSISTPHTHKSCAARPGETSEYSCHWIGILVVVCDMKVLWHCQENRLYLLVKPGSFVLHWYLTKVIRIIETDFISLASNSLFQCLFYTISEGIHPLACLVSHITPQ